MQRKDGPYEFSKKELPTLSLIAWAFEATRKKKKLRRNEFVFNAFQHLKAGISLNQVQTVRAILIGLIDDPQYSIRLTQNTEIVRRLEDTAKRIRENKPVPRPRHPVAIKMMEIREKLIKTFESEGAMEDVRIRAEEQMRRLIAKPDIPRELIPYIFEDIQLVISGVPPRTTRQRTIQEVVREKGLGSAVEKALGSRAKTNAGKKRETVWKFNQYERGMEERERRTHRSKLHRPPEGH